MAARRRMQIPAPAGEGNGATLRAFCLCGPAGHRFGRPPVQTPELAQDLLPDHRNTGTPAAADHDSLAAADHTGRELCAANGAVKFEVPGKPKEKPLPTTLPHRPRTDVKRSSRRVAFDILFNGALLVSALALTFIVLVREERYAYGQQEIANQAMQQPMADESDEIRITPPLN